MSEVSLRSSWPAGLQEIADIIGDDHAFTLADSCGGVKFYLPSSPTQGHYFCEFIPFEAFAKLCTSWKGGGDITIPRPAGSLEHRRPAVLEGLHAGLNTREAALKAKVSYSFARRVKDSMNLKHVEA